MLKSGLFSVIFKVSNVEFREEYELAYRTEEERTEGSTLYQQAKAAIAKAVSLSDKLRIVETKQAFEVLKWYLRRKYSRLCYEEFMEGGSVYFRISFYSEKEEKQ